MILCTFNWTFIVSDFGYFESVWLSNASVYLFPETKRKKMLLYHYMYYSNVHQQHLHIIIMCRLFLKMRKQIYVSIKMSFSLKKQQNVTPMKWEWLHGSTNIPILLISQNKSPSFLYFIPTVIFLVSCLEKYE